MKVRVEPGYRGLVVIYDTYPRPRRIYVDHEELDTLILDLVTARDNPDACPIETYNADEEE